MSNNASSIKNSAEALGIGCTCFQISAKVCELHYYIYYVSVHIHSLHLMPVLLFLNYAKKLTKSNKKQIKIERLEILNWTELDGRLLRDITNGTDENIRSVSVSAQLTERFCPLFPYDRIDSWQLLHAVWWNWNWKNQVFNVIRMTYSFPLVQLSYADTTIAYGYASSIRSL